jgi:lipopolysaccharide transport system ATP-binding protein
MAATSISAVGLSKRYEGPKGGDPITAVDAITFDVQRGEALGLIGRNGAGKSTLLRILSRVTRPSAGYADIYGRVGALLEVGTGFHPELSGRENTYLSGALLGLSRREVRARFDQIVAFAEIEPYLDMPVKRYSSGMYARLGFAVAAHLRPAILIVDEVLAVGDLAFQAKCLALMHHLTEDGTTVLFVSHNLLAVADLCDRALVMSGGRLSFDGPVNEAIAAYRRSMAGQPASDRRAAGDLDARLTVNGQQGAEVVEIAPNGRLDVELAVDRPPTGPDVEVILNLLIETPDGRTAIHLRSDVSSTKLALRPGRDVLAVVIDELPLAAGSYWLWLRVVGLDPNDPLIWDSQRVLLLVAGGQPMDSIVFSRHRFEQHGATEGQPSGVAMGGER